MILILLAAVIATAQGDAIGSFHHGQWQGACFRDGFLAGHNDEVCRARWAGEIDVSFDRDADGLTLVVAATSRAGRRCSRSLSFPARSLARSGREAMVWAALDAGAHALAAQCAPHRRLTPINARDLRATLRETDGLVHLSL